MDRLLSLISDNVGNISSMRVVSLIFTACMTQEAIHEVWWLNEVWRPSVESVGLVLSSLGIKQVQTHIETKNGVKAK